MRLSQEKRKEIANFLQALVEQFNRKEGIYRDDYWPLSYLPPGLDPRSLEAARYIFYFVQIDYQTRADRLVPSLQRCYQENPRYFDPEYLLSLSDEEVANILRKCGARFPTKDNKVWKYNSKILLERFQGDPRIIGAEVTTEELKQRTRDFKTLGAHGKLFWLWTVTMSDPDIGAWKILDPENIVVPVDIWIYRWARVHGLTNRRTYDKKAQEEIGKLLTEICLEYNLPLTKINHILWKYLKTKPEIYREGLTR
jgi:hypothetical protein